MSSSWAWHGITQASQSLHMELSREVGTVKRLASTLAYKRSSPKQQPLKDESSNYGSYNPRAGYEILSWNEANLTGIHKRAVVIANRAEEADKIIGKSTQYVNKATNIYEAFQRELAGLKDVMIQVTNIQDDLDIIKVQMDTINSKLTILDLLNSKVKMSNAILSDMCTLDTYRNQKQQEIDAMNTKLCNVRVQQTIDNSKKRDESIVQKKQFLDFSFQQQMQHFKEYGTLREDYVDRTKFHTSPNQLKEVDVVDVSGEKELSDFLSDVSGPDANIPHPISLPISSQIKEDTLLSKETSINNNNNNINNNNSIETPVQIDTVVKLTDTHMLTNTPSTCPESSHITNENLMNKLLQDKIEGKPIGEKQDDSPISSEMDN